MNEPDKQLPAVTVIDRVLQKRLADALHDAAVDLALQQQRIDDAAEIVDHSVAVDCRRTGIGIDLDLDDVAAVGKGLRRRHADVRGVESGLHARRQSCRIARRFRHFENIETQIGAGHAESPVGEHDVLRRDFEKMRGKLRALLDDRLARLIQRSPGDGERARAAGEPAGVRSVSPMMTSMQSASMPS